MVRSMDEDVASMKSIKSSDTKEERSEEEVKVEREAPMRQRRQSTYPYKRAAHPFLCRLDETAAFTVTAPNALIAAGFASMGMGLFTLFRPTPVLLFFLASNLNSKSELLAISKDILLTTTFSWDGLLIFVLFVLGLVLTFSVRIKRRAVLLIHPWALMVLYFDVFVWLTITLCFHLELNSLGPLSSFFRQITNPLVYFIIIYIDSVIFGFLHYIYATYFIAAELSVIERCY